MVTGGRQRRGVEAVRGSRAGGGNQARASVGAAGGEGSAAAAAMDAHCDGGEPAALGEPPPPPPPPPPPSGKLNRTAFQLFKRRKPGGALPSIFGARSGGQSRGGAGGGRGAGMVRSRTHDGLAEGPELEGGRSSSGRAADGEDAASEEAASPCPSAAAGKSHRFFSLLRKSGRCDEGGKGGRGRGRGGLRGLFGSMRWPRRERPGGGARGGQGSEGQPGPGTLNAGSLSASLECVKGEAAPGAPAGTARTPLAARDGERPRSPLATEFVPTPDPAPQPDPWGSGGEELPGTLPREKEVHPESTSSDDQEIKEDPAKTGCGDIIADQEDDVGGGGGNGGGGGERSAPGIGKTGPSEKPASVVTCQGGGEEMASPEQVGETCTQELWDLLSHTEEKSQGTSGRKESPETSKGDKIVRRVQDGSANGKHIGLSQIPVHHQKEDQKNREKEQQEAIPSSDEGYWDSTTPGPEEDNTNSIQKEVIPRDSYSGDALYDLYTDPDENTTTVTSAENTCCKPLSPITTTCPVKTHTTSLKDSKIPISIKHFTSPHGSHSQDSSNSHHIVHHQATKSEIPRTKIPVSKVLVHRASYRSLAGITGKTATYHESAKK